MVRFRHRKTQSCATTCGNESFLMDVLQTVADAQQAQLPQPQPIQVPRATMYGPTTVAPTGEPMAVLDPQTAALVRAIMHVTGDTLPKQRARLEEGSRSSGPVSLLGHGWRGPQQFVITYLDFVLMMLGTSSWVAWDNNPVPALFETFIGKFPDGLKRVIKAVRSHYAGLMEQDIRQKWRDERFACDVWALLAPQHQAEVEDQRTAIQTILLVWFNMFINKSATVGSKEIAAAMKEVTGITVVETSGAVTDWNFAPRAAKPAQKTSQPSGTQEHASKGPSKKLPWLPPKEFKKLTADEKAARKKPGAARTTGPAVKTE